MGTRGRGGESCRGKARATSLPAWVDFARNRNGLRLEENQGARDLVERREVQQKRGQARLRNDRLMRQWGGASGSGRLNYRWPVVARLLDDIAEGRENGSAGTR